MEPTASVEAPKPAGGFGMSALLAGLFLLVGTIVLLWYAPDSYQLLKALHVIAIVIWVGGDVTLTTLGIVFERRRDGETMAALGKMGAWIGTRIYTPALFVAFGFGVALVQKGQFGWSTFWIDFALAGWAIAATVGVGFVGPELGRIDAAAQKFGPDSAEVGRRVKRLFTIFRFDTALLILIVIDMTAKPSF
ncbi:MAG TPA: hypothetical protein VII51_07350 [Gaiellaceae bacterium]